MEEKGKPIEIGSAIKTYSFEDCSPEIIKDFIKSNIKVGDLICVHTPTRYKRGVVNSIGEARILIVNGGFCAFYNDIIFIEIYNKKVMKEKECACPIFRVLEKMGIRWNPEKEEIEEAKKQRWRAKRGELYYFVDNALGISSYKEEFDSADNSLWNSGNYFRTEKEAQKYADEFKRMLKGRTLDKEE